jgi:hypothetical protein
MARRKRLAAKTATAVGRREGVGIAAPRPDRLRPDPGPRSLVDAGACEVKRRDAAGERLGAHADEVERHGAEEELPVSQPGAPILVDDPARRLEEPWHAMDLVDDEPPCLIPEEGFDVVEAAAAGRGFDVAAAAPDCQDPTSSNAIVVLPIQRGPRRVAAGLVATRWRGSEAMAREITCTSNKGRTPRALPGRPAARRHRWGPDRHIRRGPPSLVTAGG